MENKKKVILTEKGKTTRDYLVMKQQEWKSEKSLQSQIDKWKNIKE